MESFGKKPVDARNLNVSQMSQAQEHSHVYDKPGGNLFYFSNQFKPSILEKTKLRIIPSDYTVKLPAVDARGQLVMGKDGKPELDTYEHVPYLPVNEHYNAAIKKGFICSGGPFHHHKKWADPCKGCEAYFAQKNATKKFMGKRSLNVVTVLILEDFAHAPLRNREGDVVFKKDTNPPEPLLNWVRLNRGNRDSYAAYEKRDWNKQFWALSYDQWNTLVSYGANFIGNSCKSCCTRDSITTEAYTCKGCGEAVIDMHDTRLTDPEISKITSSPVRCPACSVTDYLSPIINCNNCGDAERAEIFDVNLNVSVKEDNRTDIKKTQLILDYDMAPLNPKFFAINEPYKFPIASPMNALRQYAPLEFAKQDEMVYGNLKMVDPGAHTKEYKR